MEAEKARTMTKIVLSGIQPTGNLHLGNYLGSIRNWIDLKSDHDCYFGIMDLHAITLPQDPKQLKQSVEDALCVYLACGLDPKKATFFVQSKIAALPQISWVFSCLTSMGVMSRMTQFKDKASKDGGLEEAKLGLFSYPVLMAADILSFHADLVPVGDDQKQHLELTRDIAGIFNNKVGQDYFKLPDPLIVKQVKRIMSLQDGTKKMSKSDDSELSRINLTDNADLITKKVKKAKTDSFDYISYDEKRPEIYNLLNIFASFSGEDPQNIAKTYENSGFGKFKGDLAEILVEKLGQVSYNIDKLRNDKAYIADILAQGNVKANEKAKKTRAEVFDLIGLAR